MRILIANPFGIGDVLFTLPLLYALRDRMPQGFLGYLCNRRTEELVRCWPWLDWVGLFEKDEFRTLWGQSRRKGLQHLQSLLQTVRQKRFDLFLDLSMGWQYGLAAWLAGIPRRVGFNFRGRGRFLTEPLPLLGFHHQPVARCYLDLLPRLGVPIPPQIRASFDPPEEALRKAEEYLNAQHVSPGERIIGIVPGGGASWGPQAIFKRWPADRFAQVATQVAIRYGTKILLIGDAQEAHLCRTIAEAMSSHPPIQAIQVPSLLLLSGLLKRCALVIGNDSGPMHLAASMGTKTVTIFGPVDGSVYGPFGRDHRVVSKGLACRPCYQGFRFPPCPWDNACLKRLETDPVLEAVADLMGG